MATLKTTLFHALELVVILGLVYAVSYFFPELVDGEALKAVVVVVLAVLAKLARSSERSPVPDYVNS